MLILIWAVLVLLLGLEVLAAELHAGWVAFGLAPIMVALVAGGFMSVMRASPLAHIFAAAGLFWLLILVGLGGVDFFARAELQWLRRAWRQLAPIALHRAARLT